MRLLLLLGSQGHVSACGTAGILYAARLPATSDISHNRRWTLATVLTAQVPFPPVPGGVGSRVVALWSSHSKPERRGCDTLGSLEPLEQCAEQIQFLTKRLTKQ